MTTSDLIPSELEAAAELLNEGMPAYYPEIFSQYKTTGS